MALVTFATDEGIGPDRQVVLVLDQAGRHLSPRLVVPEGVHLAPLPPPRPSCNWQNGCGRCSTNRLSTRAIADLGELETILVDRCQTLRAHPARVTVHPHVRWRTEDVV
ncbi:MAG TPA: hypothetical protein VGR16_03840 [Thermomicrobiales bacterium]|nr:hypothetical protein [Thermomicrobiales bacterium]